MTLVDWLMVLVINGGIILYGLTVFKKKQESFDWYLAAKSMPWWAIGLSAFGTAVDSGDYVGIVGGSYNLGLSQLTQWWLGIAVGWFVLSFYVIVPMYRSGVFTNAEWLEFRFGPVARFLAVLINIQSRTNVLGNIFFSLFLVLNLVAEIDAVWSWPIVVAVASLVVSTVVVGDVLVTGDEICVLEAMKMQQTLRADWSGTVGTVHVQSGQQVLDGDPIVDLE